MVFPYPGLTFVLTISVALGAAIYYMIARPEQVPPHGNTSDERYAYPPSEGYDTNYYYQKEDDDRHRASTRRRNNDSTRSSSTCSICLLEITNRERQRALRCGHCFHGKCIGQWLSEHSTCPNCRVNIL